MNERIKELVEDAGMVFWPNKEIEKFAELIVRECMWKIMTRKEEAIDNQWHLDDAMSSVLRDISEHFGVD